MGLEQTRQAGEGSADGTGTEASVSATSTPVAERWFQKCKVYCAEIPTCKHRTYTYEEWKTYHNFVTKLNPKDQANERKNNLRHFKRLFHQKGTPFLNGDTEDIAQETWKSI